MNVKNRRMQKYVLTVAAIIASMSYSTANACDGALDDVTSAVGTQNGFYYDFWKQTAESFVHINCEDDGNFSANWHRVFNWAGGKGWNSEGSQVVSYAGTFLAKEDQARQNAYFMVHGSTTDPVTEYYVVESYGTYNPSNCVGSSFGSFQSDGVTYDLYRCQRVINILEGLGPKQYFSVRNPPLP